MLCGDYGFLREVSTQEVLTFLALDLRPFKAHMGLPVDIKGPDAKIVQRLARWMRACGLVHFAYRSDREPAIRALMAEAAKLAGIKGEEDHDPDEDGPPMAIPEESHP